VAARKITAHFELAPRFQAEFGPELDGTRNWKGDLLAYALTRTGETPARSVMIGDRHHDIAAAAEVGMASIAVKWGYGESEEWDHADHQAHHPSELPDMVRAILGSGDE
jgi:phosphoglycolate phosphatase